jgi:hypothetical protein
LLVYARGGRCDERIDRAELSRSRRRRGSLHLYWISYIVQLPFPGGPHHGPAFSAWHCARLVRSQSLGSPPPGSANLTVRQLQASRAEERRQRKRYNSTMMKSGPALSHSAPRWRLGRAELCPPWPSSPPGPTTLTVLGTAGIRRMVAADPFLARHSQILHLYAPLPPPEIFLSA